MRILIVTVVYDGNIYIYIYIYTLIIFSHNGMVSIKLRIFDL